MDIKVKLINDDEQLKFEISGSDINHTITNTLRRIIKTLIPIYAFHPQDIIIEKNTSVFNNDMLRLRISNLPIINKSYSKPIIDNSEKLLEKIIEFENEANLSIFESKAINLKEEELKKIKRVEEQMDNLHMTVYAKNDTNSILNVTTSEDFTTFYLKTNKIENIYKTPLLLVQLKPGEEIQFTAKASLNIQLFNGIYAATSVCASTYEENDNKIIFSLESRKQISERDIIYRACEIAKIKLNNLKDKLINNIDKNYNQQAQIKANITIENENYTMGNVITRAIQDHKNIIFCGFKVDHPNINEFTLEYETDGEKITKILNDRIIYLVKIYDIIGKQIKKI